MVKKVLILNYYFMDNVTTKEFNNNYIEFVRRIGGGEEFVLNNYIIDRNSLMHVPRINKEVLEHLRIGGEVAIDGMILRNIL